MASGEQDDVVMGEGASILESSICAATKSRSKKHGKSRELFSCTISRPPFAYAHIEASAASREAGVALDVLQVRSYCTAALTQFLGATGAGMPIDFLQVVDGRHFWLRLPSEDLGLFSAALSAHGPKPLAEDGSLVTLRVRASSSWLGSLIGHSELEDLWNDTS